jgi:hypothetical protein
MIWFYNGREVTDEDLEGYVAFVYVITNLLDGRKYIGKKRLRFVSTRTKRTAKGGKIRRKQYRESDWKSYYGSSEELKSDVALHGSEAFRREILVLCKSLSESNYYELREQMVTDALLKPQLYYNSYVGSRISRKQLGVK